MTTVSAVVGQVVTADGDEWDVIGVGASESGATYVHLASRTRRIRQRNGARPIQCCGWLRGDRLEDTP